MSDQPNPFPFTPEQIEEVQNNIEQGKVNSERFFAELEAEQGKTNAKQE
jgi:hypothetical protein